MFREANGQLWIGSAGWKAMGDHPRDVDYELRHPRFSRTVSMVFLIALDFPAVLELAVV